MISTTTLKNAARAIGYDLWSDPDGSHYLVDYDGVKLKRWDPEHNDQDAYRLAAELFDAIEFVTVEWPDEVHGVVMSSVDYAATRQSIVEAAAEIGAAKCKS